MSVADDIRIRDMQILAKGWGILRKFVFDQRRRDGEWQTLTREVYDAGNGAAILLYDPGRGTVVLTRQFRIPAYAGGHPGWLVEVPAGHLDDRSPEACIRAEAEEESGFRVAAPRRVFEAFASPGSFAERITFFVAEYSARDRVAGGGGVAAEGEDIEVFETPLGDALAMVDRGEIVDAKTILLLQYAALKGLLGGGG